MNGWSFSLEEQKFAQPFEKSLVEDIFDSNFEGSEVYVLECKGEEAGVIVMQNMEWNNTLLIHHLYVTQQFKRKGVGSVLLDFAHKRARFIDYARESKSNTK